MKWIQVNLRKVYFSLSDIKNSIHSTDIYFRDMQMMGYYIQKFLTKQFKNPQANKLLKIVNILSDNKLKSYLVLFYPIKYTKIPSEIIDFGTFKHPVTNAEYKGNFYTLWNDALNLSTSFLKAVNDFIFLDCDESVLKSIIKDYSLDVGLVKTKVSDAKYFSPLSLTID